ncbi:MATE family efflux transporter [Butyricimonas synergistica]|uniref:MATE family efflux transporter n=1 Tax=Butyricimonas synergistica TaxID=544644 RepID=UPI000476BA80|nr:MATE family efflux transporter [Butyricimonas synergistica]
MDQSSRETVRMDMLHGSLLNKILLFALPLAASSILQQLFNSVDVAVVGKFASSQALAAVGSNGSVISLMINLFVGISVGASVVIANYIGQKNQRGIKNAIHTVSVVTLTSGILLLAIGLFSARPILEMMDTPDDVLDLAVLYLRIYFLGMPFFMIYNFGAAILRSMGDTKRPLYCLVIAGLINTALNLLLVIVFKMSVAGVAIATVVSNMFCAGMVIYILLHEQEPFRLEIKDIKISRPELRKMLQIGIPAGVQGMVFSIANVFIQAATNRFGSNAIAGSAAALTYEYYCYFVVNAFSQAAVTFISQNYGAGQIERCKKVFRQTMLLSVISCALLNGLFVWQEKLAIGIFTSSPEVFRFAAIRMEIVLLTQSIACSYEIAGAALRGLGYSMLPAILTVFGTCVLRLFWVYVICPLLPSFQALMVIYPISWIVTGMAVLIAYHVVQKKLFRPHEIRIS